MIIEIALGVALGLFLYANWRGILTLGILVGLFLMLLVTAGATLWALYAALQAVKSLPPIVQPGSSASTVLGVGFGLFANILIAFAIGTVLEQRLRLAAREAHALGVAFYVLLLTSAIGIPLAVEAYAQTGSRVAILLSSLLLTAWVLAIQQSVRRARQARLRIAA